MLGPIVNERILVAAAASCSVTLRDQDGEPVAAAGTVTVDIARADGTVIATARATTQDSPPIVGVYKVALTATETASLDILTLTWKDTTVARVTTRVEIVGRYYFGLQEARNLESSLANRSVYSDETLKAFRRAVEEEAERVAGCAFVPRYRRIVVAGNGVRELPIPDTLPTRLRELTPTVGTAWTSGQLASVILRPEGALIVNAYAVSTVGFFPPGPVTVAYEYGYERPPEPVKNMAIRRLRYLANLAKSPSNDRQARLILDAETGRTLMFSASGAYKTGDDEVDAVYWRHGMRAPAIA